MAFLQKFLSPKQPCEDALIHLCKYMKLKITSGSLKKKLLEHPNYPSLASVGDVLNEFGVMNTCIKVPLEKIKSLPVPFIAHMGGDKSAVHNIFVPIYDKSDAGFKLYNPKTKLTEFWTNDSFSKSYSGIVMLLEIDENSGEKAYSQLLAKERKQFAQSFFLISFLPIITIIYCLYTVTSKPINLVIAPTLFTIITLIGPIISALIIWHDIDKYNPIVRQVCKPSTKVNCTAVLNSKGARIFGISWSLIGFTYFSGMLLTLLMSGIVNQSTLKLLSILNFFTLPYIIYSVYYQAIVLKQWCLLCLLIQALLFLQFLAAYLGNFYSKYDLSHDIIAIETINTTLSFVIIFACISILINLIRNSKEDRIRTTELQRLKNDYEIFSLLLERQKIVQHSPKGLGIQLGKPDAPYKLIKVCNPYCDPCAKAHPIAKSIIENNEEVSLQIIFTATTNENDQRKAPTAHLLALTSVNEKNLIKTALDDWYSTPDKNYDTFASKYPLNGELNLQDAKIAEMKKWCDISDVSFTPTFFVCLGNDNNSKYYELPRIYTLNDLKYFLSI